MTKWFVYCLACLLSVSNFFLAHANDFDEEMSSPADRSARPARSNLFPERGRLKRTLPTEEPAKRLQVTAASSEVPMSSDSNLLEGMAVDSPSGLECPPIQTLVKDAYHEIFRWMDPASLAALGGTCQSFHEKIYQYKKVPALLAFREAARILRDHPEIFSSHRAFLPNIHPLITPTNRGKLVRLLKEAQEYADQGEFISEEYEKALSKIIGWDNVSAPGRADGQSFAFLRNALGKSYEDQYEQVCFERSQINLLNFPLLSEKTYKRLLKIAKSNKRIGHYLSQVRSVSSDHSGGLLELSNYLDYPLQYSDNWPSIAENPFAPHRVLEGIATYAFRPYRGDPEGNDNRDYELLGRLILNPSTPEPLFARIIEFVLDPNFSFDSIAPSQDLNSFAYKRHRQFQGFLFHLTGSPRLSWQMQYKLNQKLLETHQGTNHLALRGYMSNPNADFITLSDAWNLSMETDLDHSYQYRPVSSQLFHKLLSTSGDNHKGVRVRNSLASNSVSRFTDQQFLSILASSVRLVTENQQRIMIHLARNPSVSSEVRKQVYHKAMELPAIARFEVMMNLGLGGW